MAKNDDPAGTFCLVCGSKPASTTNNGTTVPMCSGCAKLAKNPRGVKMVGRPKKRTTTNLV